MSRLVEAARRAALVCRWIVGDPSNSGRSGLQVVRACCWQLWKRIVRRPWKVRLFNGMVFLAAPTSPVASMAVYYHMPYCREMEYLRRQVDGGVLVDVGANVGLFTLCLADRLRHAVLVEPAHEAAAMAKSNLQLNGLSFEVVEGALSDHHGEADFKAEDGLSPLGGIVSTPGAAGKTVRVRCTTLDRLAVERGWRPGDIDVIKIDVEGHEERVLRGGVDVIGRLRPRMVMFEYLERSNLAEIRRLFEALGYRIHELRAGRLIPVGNRVRPCQDLFAVPAAGTEGGCR